MDAGHLDWIQSIRKKLELEEGVKHSLKEVLKSIKCKLCKSSCKFREEKYYISISN
jgi:hypothetical protein